MLALVGPQRELTDDRADDGARGLRAAIQHEQALLEDLLVGPRAALALALGLRPDRDQVVTGLGAAFVDERAGWSPRSR